MTDLYSEAHKRLDRILIFFFILCVAGTVVGILHQDWWFAAVWLLAGLFNGAIGASVRKSASSISTLSDDEDHNARIFAKNISKFGLLLTATMIAAGFALGLPWWINLLAGAGTWFVGVFGIMWLCVPRKKTRSL